MRKLRRDSALECRVAVFRIENLSHGAHKFKVNMNAQQLALNGVCIIADKKLGLNLPNVVVVEGGPKAIKFYKKLMLRRIKWNLGSQREAAPGVIPFIFLSIILNRLKESLRTQFDQLQKINVLQFGK